MVPVEHRPVKQPMRNNGVVRFHLSVGTWPPERQGEHRHLQGLEQEVMSPLLRHWLQYLPKVRRNVVRPQLLRVAMKGGRQLL
jgi:hypothetical protein